MDKTFRDKQNHIDHERTKNNIVLVHEPVGKAYKFLFDDARKAYNEKQIAKGHPERQIDNYLQKIRNDKRKHEAYEIIIQVGARHNKISDREAVTIFTEYVNEFEKRNPNFYVIGAYIHLDEETQHLHLNYVAYGRNFKTGMEIQNSLKQALAEQGYTTQKKLGTAQEQWTRSEREQLELLCREHNIVIEHKKESREHLNKETYILLSQKKELEKENEKMLKILDNIERKYKKIERAEIKPASPQRTLTGKSVIDFSEHKAIIDKMNAENYKLRKDVSMWRDRAMTHAEARERLEHSLRAENERYIERDIEVEQLKKILQFSKKPQEEYLLWEKEHDYELDINHDIAKSR